MTCEIGEFDSLPSNGWERIDEALAKGRLVWRGLSLAALGTLAARFEVDCKPFERTEEGRWQASRWVGGFSYGGQTWRIKPRIGWPRFMAMLGGVFSIGVSEGGGLQRLGDSDLTSLVWLLAFQAAWNRHRGAAKVFVRREERDAKALRGQLDIEAQLTKLVDRHNFTCRYDELSYDNPINRGTLLALKVLKRHGRFPFSGTNDHHRVARQWQEALLTNGVQTPEHFPVGPMRWSRANDGFRAAHILAELVVGERQTSVDSGGRINAFLFDSAEVWEMYLHNRLLNAIRTFPDYVVEWPRGRRGEPDYLLDWEGKRIVAQIPDLRILRPDNTVAVVIDAKYRHFQPPTKDGEIALQMFHYAATASRRDGEALPPAMLIYPSCESLNEGKGEGPFEFGHGRFLIGCKSPLSAWGVRLPYPEGNNPNAFHHSVDDQLTQILSKVMLPGDNGQIAKGARI